MGVARALARVLVLVGLPGAGKSTTGPIVAAQLGWRFVDLDQEIERAEGRSVAEIFAAEGEATFRRLEHAHTRLFAAADGLVFTPGGGWMLDVANPEVFGERALTVYLRISPKVALERLGAETGMRPLLAGPDPLATLQRLLAAREAGYMHANHVLAVDSMTPAEVADSIVALATGSVPD